MPFPTNQEYGRGSEVLSENGDRLADSAYPVGAGGRKGRPYGTRVRRMGEHAAHRGFQ